MYCKVLWPNCFAAIMLSKQASNDDFLKTRKLSWCWQTPCDAFI